MIGEIVLFRIHEDPNVDRPLLVVSERPGSSLSGELFLDWESDRSTLWIQQHAFYAPHQGARTMEVKQVEQGFSLGRWHRRPQA